MGTIEGTKSVDTLSGLWSGAVDGVPQSGEYQGKRPPGTDGFFGTYTVAAGKQLRIIPGCIHYFIAPKGAWEVFPIGARIPHSFDLQVTGTKVRYTPPAGATFALVSVIDEAQALAGGQEAKHQAMSGAAGEQELDLADVSGLTAGQTYVVSVSAFNTAMQRVAAASVRLKR